MWFEIMKFLPWSSAIRMKKVSKIIQHVYHTLYRPYKIKRLKDSHKCLVEGLLSLTDKECPDSYKWTDNCVCPLLEKYIENVRVFVGVENRDPENDMDFCV